MKPKRMPSFGSCDIVVFNIDFLINRLKCTIRTDYMDVVTLVSGSAYCMHIILVSSKSGSTCLTMIFCSTYAPSWSLLAWRRALIAGHGMRRGSISPTPRQRLDDSHYDPDFDHSVGLHSRRGLPGRGGGARFRDISPQNGLGRGGRVPGRGYNLPGSGSSPTEGEYVHRNDPNLSPREGDWICQNPSCGNLNFARRAYCNNCNHYRFGSGSKRTSRSPRRGYYNSPSPYESPPRMSGAPAGRGRRDVHGYRSPPRRLVVDDSGNFETGSAPAARGGKFPYPLRRERPDYHEDEFLERGKPDWPVHDEWDRRDRRRDVSFPDRRVYDEQPRAPSPHDRWVRESRERSRSPLGARPLKGGSYMGRGRDDRRFRDSYISHGQADDLDAGRGRGFRRAKDSFANRGRGDRSGMARGRSADIY